MVDDAEYEELMARKAALPKTRFGDGYDPVHVERIERLMTTVLGAGIPVDLWIGVVAGSDHAECIGGDVDLLCNRRATIGFFPWRFVDGESCIGRCVAMVDDAEYEELMARKASLPKTRFGDGYEQGHVESIERLTKRF